MKYTTKDDDIITCYEKPVKILQGGFWKSGNYLLFRILKDILTFNNLYETFYTKSGVSNIISKLCGGYLVFPEQSEIPEIFVKDSTIAIEFHHPLLKFIYPDPDTLFQTSSLLWSHENVSLLKPFLGNFTHKIFIVRKSEAVINSFMHHHVRPPLVNIDKNYKIKNIDDLYERYDIFEKYVDEYCAYMDDFFYIKNELFVISYLQLREEKIETIRKICEYLKLDYDPSKVEEQTSFESFKKNEIRHARSGDNLDYQKYFTDKHYQIIKKCYKYDEELCLK